MEIQSPTRGGALDPQLTWSGYRHGLTSVSESLVQGRGQGDRSKLIRSFSGELYGHTRRPRRLTPLYISRRRDTEISQLCEGRLGYIRLPRRGLALGSKGHLSMGQFVRKQNGELNRRWDKMMVKHISGKIHWIDAP